MKNVSLRVLTAVVGMTLGLAASLPAAAQWKWRDASGKVQYSDRPPPASVTDKDVLQRPAGARKATPPVPATEASAPAAPVAKPAAPGVDKELEERRKKEAQEQEAKAKAEEERLAKARAENCTRAKNYQQTLDSGIRIARTNEKGEREILDDAARAKEVERAKQVIASDCK
ncbi:DUF4124 domain-containing protein [Caldimonas brevitalea]|uniref:Transmembrane protein n=1 Tax=Caldimonas brevitalea TaxID=413882 RepID=A0A0G3BRM1_9BURK|nr:DUF4124 domain-containing protein [Caldimonas brevitalea]AKJ29190.1 transmembrane protein [Caldimonas brevitalea]